MKPEEEDAVDGTKDAARLNLVLAAGYCIAVFILKYLSEGCLCCKCALGCEEFAFCFVLFNYNSHRFK